MSELKKCPFCGEPADDRYQRLAKCCNDKCLMNEWVEDGTLFYLDEVWNNRPIEDALTARIAELEYQLEDWTNNGWAEDYKTRIAELEAAQRWIPVSERLPEPYTRVLACIKSGYMEVDYMYSEPIVDVGIADFNSLDNVTHWMPLPEPPEVK